MSISWGFLACVVSQLGSRAFHRSVRIAVVRIQRMRVANIDIFVVLVGTNGVGTLRAIDPFAGVLE